MQNTILLADDDVELSDLLKEYFESEGFGVRVAYDGLAALEQARQPGLDLVVLGESCMTPAIVIDVVDWYARLVGTESLRAHLRDSDALFVPHIHADLFPYFRLDDQARAAAGSPSA